MGATIKIVITILEATIAIANLVTIDGHLVRDVLEVTNCLLYTSDAADE